MSHTTLVCGDPYLKKFFLREDGTATLVVQCQRLSGHTGEHAAVWISGCVTWRYSD